MLTGYAAVFYKPGIPGTQYQLNRGIVERIRPGAFDKALRERQDTICCWNHDADYPLGRVSSGTCRLSVDSVGLKYSCDLPQYPFPPGLVELLERRDVSGSSFQFVMGDDQWEEDGSSIVRWVNEIALLIDVGPVTTPAYAASTATIAGSPPIRAAVPAVGSDAVAVRLRMLAIDEERERDRDAVAKRLRQLGL